MVVLEFTYIRLVPLFLVYRTYSQFHITTINGDKKRDFICVLSVKFK